MSNFIFTKDQLELIEALESGKYKQCTNKLYDPETGGFCCLGVACVINGVPITNGYYRRSRIPQNLGASSKTRAVRDKLKLKSNMGATFNFSTSLAGLNDSDYSFKFIAKRLRESPEEFFTNGAES